LNYEILVDFRNRCCDSATFSDCGIYAGKHELKTISETLRFSSHTWFKTLARDNWTENVCPKSIWFNNDYRTISSFFKKLSKFYHKGRELTMGALGSTMATSI